VIMPRALLLAILFAGLLAVGCRETGSGGGNGTDGGTDTDVDTDLPENKIVGSWLRERVLYVGERIEVTRYEYTFEADLTFTYIQSFTPDLPNDPFSTEQERSGTYAIDAQGNLSQSGVLVDASDDEYQFQIDRFAAWVDSPDAVFISGGLMALSDWPYAERYSILVSEADGTHFERSLSTYLADSADVVLEDRTVSLEVEITGSECAGSASYHASGAAVPEDDYEGPFTSCEYAATPAVEVDGYLPSDDPWEQTIEVKAFVFTYEHDGMVGTQQEFYMEPEPDSNPIGYNPSEQAAALSNSVYLRM
jgi:hypothetical protein